MSENEVITDSQSNMIGRALLLLIGTTGFEVAGLILWVELDARAMSGIGLIVLFIALVLERLVITGIPRKLNTWFLILGSSWWEYAAWALWFTLILSKGLSPIGVFLLVLLPGLHFQHCFLISVSVNKSFGELVRHPGFIIFSLIEAIGGGLWLAAFTGTSIANIPAHLIILIAITIEHIVQGVVLNSINQEGQLAQMSRAS